VERLEGEVAYARSGKEIESLTVKNKLMLSVEDARILCGRLDRLSVLYARGIRFLIPVWGGKTIIGGAHDTDEGLTEFGKSVIEECFKVGIIPDTSHSSEKTAQEIIDMAALYEKSVMASHSNSYSICPHTRNLRDYQFEQVKKAGGIVGISLCSLHITKSGEASIDDVVRHIEHYLSLGGEDTVALGCDFDGTDMLPNGLKALDDIPRLADRLSQLGYTDKQINKIFYQNAKDFIDKNL
jgi:membrane dipeptidase